MLVKQLITRVSRMAGTKLYLPCGDATCKNLCSFAKSRVRGNYSCSSQARARTDLLLNSLHWVERQRERHRGPIGNIRLASAQFRRPALRKHMCLENGTYLSWLSRTLCLSRCYGLASNTV